MYAVQSVEWDAPLELEEWHAARVAPPRTAAVLAVRELAQLPRHVKRVRRGAASQHVLLWPLGAHSIAAEQAVREAVAPDELVLEPVQVPRHPVYRREWAPQWNAHWPCALLGSPAASPPMQAADEARMRTHMRAAALLGGVDGVGCVVVDPTTDRALGAACNSADEGPEGHAVWRALRAVARAQLADPARYAAHLLCSGYVVVATHEPCIACSMACLHARVGCVVFHVRSDGVGGLAGPLLRVGSHRPLNHHFAVYGGCAPQE